MGNSALNFDKLLAPITEGSPAGVDLRTDYSPSSLYYQIKDARNLARTNERRLMQGETTDNNATPAWQKVLSLAEEILASKSKDFEICIWYSEALLREHQFTGLKEGFVLVRKICEQYWNDLYPLPDEEGFSGRLALLGGLNGDETNGTLIAPIFNVPLTSSKKLGSFAFWQYQQAKAISQISDPDKRAKRLAEGNVDLSTIELAISDTPLEFLKSLIDDLKSCVAEHKKLMVFLEQKCNQDTPPSSRIQESLDSCLEIIQYLSRDLLVDNNTSTESGDNHDGDQNDIGLSNKIQGREEALLALVRIADFFLTTEPHSPLSYLIRKVVRWGRLPFPVLLNELIVDDRVREQTFTLTGVEEQKQ